jgi:hypothetical protein
MKIYFIVNRSRFSATHTALKRNVVLITTITQSLPIEKIQSKNPNVQIRHDLMMYEKKGILLFQ